MYIKQISVFVENKAGRLAEITTVIAEKGINVRALSVSDTTDFGILRLVVDKPDEAIGLLKEAGLTVSLNNVIAISVQDIPGGFASVVKVLSDAEITVEYIYAFIARTQGSGYAILKVNNDEAAVSALGKAGIQTLGEADIV